MTKYSVHLHEQHILITKMKNRSHSAIAELDRIDYLNKKIIILLYLKDSKVA